MFKKPIELFYEFVKILQKNKFIFIGFTIIIMLVVADQYTKHSALNTINNLGSKTNYIHNSIKYTSFFNLVLVWNSGVSFGLFNNHNLLVSRILFIIISIITLYIIYLMVKSKDYFNTSAYSFIAAGAIGNIIDRINYGAVIDFLDFHYGQYHWPVFNFADSFVFIGVFSIIAKDLFFKKIKN